MARSRMLFGVGVVLLLALAAFGVRAWRAPVETPVSSPAPQREGSFRDAFVEIAVASPLPPEVMAKWQERSELLALLGSFLSGGPGEAGRLLQSAREILQSEQRSSFEVMSADRFILPPREDAELVAPGLSPEQRAQFFASQSVLVLRVRGDGGPPHFVARIGFGLAVAVAEQVGGFIDDDVRRRVETPAELKARSALPEIRSAFNDGSISIEFNPDEDASDHGRLLSLGMRRFGGPDLELRDVSLRDAPGLSRALTAFCRLAAEAPLPARRHIEPSQLRFGDSVASGAAFEAEFVPAALAEGNPDNELREVLLDAETRRRLAQQLILVEAADAGLHAESDAELAARVATVRAALPGILARFRSEGGELFLLVDFEAPEGVEAMWVQVESVQPDGVLRGTLANEPAHVHGLHHGDPVQRTAPVVSGYRLETAAGVRVAFP